jgi:exosortase D (VPLPA-CTERM-specific)
VLLVELGEAEEWMRTNQTNQTNRTDQTRKILNTQGTEGNMEQTLDSEVQATVNRGATPHLIWAGVLTLVFIAAYWISLKGIVHVWSTNDDYSYGYLIPLISAYLFWEMRRKISGLELKPSWGVLPVLALFVLLSIYGILGSSENISRPATPIVYMLLFAFVFGLEAFKRFALPLCFLIFMVPLPAVLDRTFGVFLKSVSSHLGGMLIRVSGLSVYVSGNVIDLGVTQLQVVDACSGLRFVFPLFALGIVYAYFFEKTRWKQIFCVVATLPVAIITNGLRIGITGILTHYIGPEVAQGFFHDFSGWVIFMVAFVFLFVLGRILRFFPPRDTGSHTGKSYPYDGATTIPSPRQSRSAYIIALALMAVVGILGISTGALPPVLLKNGIAAFPKSFDGWQGTTQSLDAEIVDRSGAEEAFSGFYRNAANESVSLYIGYRSTSFLENENFFHSPTVCLPSSGWKQLQKTTHLIPDVPVFGQLEVTQMLVEQLGVRQLVYFWFQTKDRSTHDKNINRLHLTLHALNRDNTHDLFIRTITPIQADEPIEAVQKRMDGFVRSTMAAMDWFLAENIVTFN